jgi:outer membrane protein OmpA-like peptidoglycan-associated protein
MRESLQLLIAGGLAASLMAGCTGVELSEAENARPTGTGFSAALYKEYIDLAKSEYGQGDYRDSDHYALKAIAAAKAQPGDPDQVAIRQLPKEYVGEITGARARLVKAFDVGGRDKQPALAARAQSMFDCWMEQQEENFQSVDIARCRTEYMAAMAQLEGAMRPQTVAAPPAPAPEAKSFVVYFDLNSTKLTPESQRIVTQAIDAAKARGVNQVSLVGHADLSGASPYNTKLSGMRVRAVADQLKKGGVSDNLLSIGALGDTVPAVKTPPGTREAKNRRVEITIK